MSSILLLEPDSILGTTYQKALERAGHAVLWSRSAQEAVALADESSIDAVVLELQLPGHSGIEFLYEFRSYPEWQGIPVVLHTFVPPRDVTVPAELGIVAHVYKPDTTLKQLVSHVNEAASVRP